MNRGEDLSNDCRLALRKFQFSHYRPHAALALTPKAGDKERGAAGSLFTGRIQSSQGVSPSNFLNGDTPWFYNFFCLYFFLLLLAFPRLLDGGLGG